MTNKFRVGDRVRVVVEPDENHHPDETFYPSVVYLGQLGNVVVVYRDGEWIDVLLDGDNPEDPSYFYESEIEKM